MDGPCSLAPALAPDAWTGSGPGCPAERLSVITIRVEAGVTIVLAGDGRAPAPRSPHPP